jgi:hypothetical protein
MKRVFRLAGVVVLALIAMGCATSHTTLVRPDLGGGQVIYRISEEQAFTTALEAYAVFLPKQSVDDVIDGSRCGYSADERWGLDYWTHRTLVIPAVGTDANGNEVRGYWYEISGSGTATVVTNVRDGSYETDGRAYLGLKRDARDIKLGARSPEAATADRLSELKSMRDKGLITEEEYQAKRRQILDRM